MKSARYLAVVLIAALLLSGCSIWQKEPLIPGNGGDENGEGSDPPDDNDDHDPIPPAEVPAFPGAEGFGAEATGGRGGRVIFVTNLNDSSPGSLRAAIEASGPRIVVFKVSGIIELNKPLEIKNGDITIAGQTSPEGITIANRAFRVKAENVIVRHIRVRLGDIKEVEEDAVELDGAYNVVLDHVTASWGIDETLSIRNSDLMTIQWCIVSEALNDSIHGKGEHGYGSLIRGSFGQQVSLHHNLYAHNRGRNPRPGNYEPLDKDPIGFVVDWRNNVIYNWGGGSAGNNEDKDTITFYNFVGNYYKRGPNSTGAKAFKDNAPYAQAYWYGNAMDGNVPSNQWDLVSGTGPEKSSYIKHTSEIPVAYVETHSAKEAYDLVLASAGAFPRDAIDYRVVNTVQSPTDRGKIIDSQSEVVSSWPAKQAIKTKQVVDPTWKDDNNNGIPDWWEQEKGVKNGNHNQVMPSGYTAIEEYINWVADELVK